MLLYDPPSGWMFGFPKPYKPLEGESIRDTLLRDGYPAKDVEFASKYCRFMGPLEELNQLTESNT
jgi:hypothetical protein